MKTVASRGIAILKNQDIVKEMVLSRKERTAILFILALSFCYMYFFNTHPIIDIGGDGLVYNRLAVNMLEGHGFSQCAEPPYTPSISRTPAYPALIAAVYFLFGKERYDVVRVLQIVLMLASALFVFAIAWMVTGSKIVSFLALVLSSFYGYSFFGSGVYSYLLTETLTIILVNASICFMLLAMLKKRTIYFVVLGILLALSMLTRPSNLFFPMAVALFFLGTKPAKRTISLVVLMMIVTATAVLPWTIRNYRCFHTFVPLSNSLLGLNVYSGAVINNPDFLPYPGCDYRKNGFEPTLSQQKRFNTAEEGYSRSYNYGGAGGMEVYVYDDSMLAVGLEIIKENKTAFVKKWFFRILGHWHFADVANRLNGVHPSIGLTGYVKIAIKFFLLFVVGFGISRYIRNPRMYSLLIFPIYNTLIYTLFHAQLRYSFPARSFVIILFAMGLWEIIRRIWRRPIMFAGLVNDTAGLHSEKNIPLL